MKEVIGYTLDDIFPKIRDIKEEFLELQDKYNNVIFTKILEEKIYDDFYEFFEFWELNDLQYKIKIDKKHQRIIFDPIRKIDEYAILGILNNKMIIE